MLVKDWMSTRVVTIDAHDSVQDAKNMLDRLYFHMLPVTEQGKLVGVVTIGDIDKASAYAASTMQTYDSLKVFSKIKVKEVMTKDPNTVPFDFTLEEAAEVLLNNKIEGVPVVDYERKLVGTITQTDIFRALVIFTGVGKKGVQFAVEVVDRPGCIRKITDTIRDYGGRIASIITSFERAPKGHRKLYIRAYNIDRPRLERLKEVLGKKAVLLYIVDHDGKRGEIY